MSCVSNFISLCNPCSPDHHALKRFKDLGPNSKIFIAALTGFVAALTFGLLAVLSFRCLVRVFSAKDLSKEKSNLFNHQKVKDVAEKGLFTHEKLADLRNSKASPFIVTIAKNPKDPNEVDELIKKETKYIQTPDANGNLPLHWAVKENNLEILKRLIPITNDINSRNNAGRTALSLAAEKGQDEILKELLISNANAEIPDNQGNLPLHWAALKGHFSTTMLLPPIVNEEIKQNHAGCTALSLATEKGNIKIVQYLLNKIDAKIPDNNGRLPLHWAAFYAHLSIVKLLAPLTDLNAQDKEHKTALTLATERNHIDIVNYLVEKKAKINIKYEDKYRNLPLHWAAINGSLENVQTLIKAKAHVNSLGRHLRTALSFAAEKGHLDIVRYLLNNRADGNICDDVGFLPLHWAADAGHLEIVQLLTNYSNVNSQVYDPIDEDFNGPTVLMLAIGENIEIVKFLLDKKANVILLNKKDGNHSLHIAAQKGLLEVVKLLVPKMEIDDINNQNIEGKTPLYCAAKAGHLGVVEFLLANGADPTIPNKKGHFVLAKAERRKWSKVVDMIKKFVKPKEQEEAK